MNLERVLCVPTSQVDGRFDQLNIALSSVAWSAGLFPFDFEQYVERDNGDGTGCEFDETFQQIIPYVVVRNRGRVLCYQRRGGGEKRLDAKLSIGIGGHINDGDATYLDGVIREIREELTLPKSWQCPPLQTLAVIRETDTPVGRVHTGLLHLLDLEDATIPTETPVYSYVHPEILKGHPRLERWSQIAIDILYGA
jgi:predicted NUDIX family phosphoesterase